MDKKTFFPLFLVVVSALPLEVVNAGDWIFLPRLTTGVMQYQYEVGTVGSASAIKDEVKLDEYLPFLGLGMTFAAPKDKIFISTYFQTTTTEDIEGKGTFADSRNTELNRQHFSVSVGSQNLFGSPLSASVGYKYGNTSYDWTEADINIGQVQKENDFIAKGPFIGVAYSWKIGKDMMLGVRYSYAWLDGEITTNQTQIGGVGDEQEVVARNRTEQIFSKANGVNFGVSWNGPITDKLSYGISLDGSKYNYEPKRGLFSDSLFTDNNAGLQLLDLAPYEVKETVFSVSFLLRYRF